jgi:hypothetical protein
MPNANWIDQYPHVKALLQREGEPLDYAPDAAGLDGPDEARETRSALAYEAELARIAADIRAHEQAGCWGPPGWPLESPRETRRATADEDETPWVGPSPLRERYFPPMDLSPMLPLTWAMVVAAWPRLMAGLSLRR